MDNGLIFPYPRERVHDESFDTNYPNQYESSDELRGA